MTKSDVEGPGDQVNVGTTPEQTKNVDLTAIPEDQLRSLEKLTPLGKINNLGDTHENVLNAAESINI